MTICNLDQIDNPNKIGAKVGTSIITVIYIAFLYLIFQLYYLEPPKLLKQLKPQLQPKYENTFTGRLVEFTTKLGNSINLGMIVAILSSALVIGFNSYIMTPIITTIFPIDITTNISIPGIDASIAPGQFFIALIGFIISLILFFWIGEFIYWIAYDKEGKHKKIGNYNILSTVFVLLLFAFLTGMFIWNIVNLVNQPDCVPSTPTSEIRQNDFKTISTPIPVSTPIPTYTPTHRPLPPFGVFG